MTDLTELFQRVESDEFASSLNIASSRSRFLRYLSNTEEFKLLQTMLRDDETVAERLLSRIERSARIDVDYKYEHPKDVSLAVYSWALYSVYDDLGEMAAEMVASTNSVWWGRLVATLILEGRRKRTTEQSTVDATEEFVAPGFLGVRQINLCSSDATRLLPATGLLVRLYRQADADFQLVRSGIVADRAIENSMAQTLMGEALQIDHKNRTPATNPERVVWR